MKKANKIEQYEIGSGLSRKGVTPSYGLAIGFTAWAAPMIVGLGFLFNETAIKSTKEYLKERQTKKINESYSSQRHIDDLVPNKLFDLEKSVSAPDKLTMRRTYQVMPTFENVADKYL